MIRTAVTTCPECGRVFLRHELSETDYRCKFPDCDAVVPGERLPPLGRPAVDPGRGDGADDATATGD